MKEVAAAAAVAEGPASEMRAAVVVPLEQDQ